MNLLRTLTRRKLRTGLTISGIAIGIWALVVFSSMANKIESTVDGGAEYYAGKIVVHPTPLKDLDELWARAAIGPVPGEVALALGVAFHLTWVAVALVTLRSQRSVGLPKRRSDSDLLAKVAAGY